MKIKKHLIWVIPLFLFLLILIFGLVLHNIREEPFVYCLPHAFALLILFALAIGIVYVIFNTILKLVRKVLKKEKPVKSKIDIDRIITCGVLLASAQIAIIMGAFGLLFGCDPFYELFIDNPYMIKTEYDEEWMVGKTYDEIKERYGEPNHGHPKFEYSPNIAAYAIKYESKQHRTDSWYETIFLVAQFDTGENHRLDGSDICTGTYRK